MDDAVVLRAGTAVSANWAAKDLVPWTSCSEPAGWAGQHLALLRSTNAAFLYRDTQCWISCVGVTTSGCWIPSRKRRLGRCKRDRATTWQPSAYTCGQGCQPKQHGWPWAGMSSWPMGMSSIGSPWHWSEGNCMNRWVAHPTSLWHQSSYPILCICEIQGDWAGK